MMESVAMKRLFLMRGLFHLSGCLIPVIYLLADKGVALLVTGSAVVAAAFVETLRIKGRISLAFVGPLLKEKEMKGPTGCLFYLISCLVTILLFDKRVASASIFVLAISDPLSAIVGSKWGRRSLYGKSAEGTGAFFFSALLVLACFSFKWPGLILAAGAATAAELFSSKFVDDNLTIPIVTAFALTVLTR
jgi:dolichol kinase